MCNDVKCNFVVSHFERRLMGYVSLSVGTVEIVWSDCMTMVTIAAILVTIDAYLHIAMDTVLNILLRVVYQGVTVLL